MINDAGYKNTFKMWHTLKTLTCEEAQCSRTGLLPKKKPFGPFIPA
jgi:hypothetical protein